MSKTLEIPDIAQWEETDSELAKYKIQALNALVNSYKRQNEFLEASIKHIEQVNTNLYKRIDKAIEYIKELYEIAKEQDSDNVNLIDRLEIILKTLRGEE